MAFETAVETYFTGMRNEGLFSTLPLGAVLLAFALALLIFGPRDTFSYWAGVPLGAVGLMSIVAGIGFAQFAASNLPETLSVYQADPSGLLTSEAARVDGIMRGSYAYFALYGALMIAAFVLLFVVRKDWSMGLAIPLMAFGAMAFCSDVFMQKRSIMYQAEIAAAQR